jgi:single-strand DNA-binding protein
MKDINKVFLIGRICADAELLYAKNGTAITSFTIASNDDYKDKKVVSFFDCKQFSDKITKYLLKGGQIGVEGKLTQSRWEKDKQKHSRVEIIVDQIQFLSKPPEKKEITTVEEYVNQSTNPWE